MKLKDVLLRSALVVSIFFSVLLVSNCDDLFNHIPVFPGHGGNTRPPEFGGSVSSNSFTSLFVAVANDAGSNYGVGSTVGWALSAIGLSDESGPDYSAQFDKIDQDLQEISSQLNVISNQLTDIYNELKVINCTLWSSNITSAQTSIGNRMFDLQRLMGRVLDTTSSNNRLDINDMRDWVTSVLGDSGAVPQGDISIQSAMGNLQQFLPGGANGGVIPACVQAILKPADNTFGTDTVYYNQVKLLLNYFYGYQVEALYLYSEAEHFRAWQNAGSPNSDFYSSDSVSAVCLPSASSEYSKFCQNVIYFTNFEYNTIINQFTEGGASYTDENLVFMYNSSQSYLWPLSLEDFTTANGDNCADPLTSDNPCGITAGYYDSPGLGSIVYKGYSGWSNANSDQLTQMLSGWTANLSGIYLSKLGFKNMVNKIFISSNYVEISLNETGSNQYVIPFFDTGLEYSDFGGMALTEIQFQDDLLTKTRSTGGLCSGFNQYYDNVDYNTNSRFPSNANPFYFAKGHARHCGSDYITPFSFSIIPGWLAKQNNTNNHEPAARQYRWPVLSTDKLTCTENRDHTNIAGMQTMCGDDFTAFLDFNVPRPPTCDSPHYFGTPCALAASSVANAISEFSSKYKTGRSL